MPEAPTTEPWAGTEPVPHALRPGAMPEAYMAKIAEGDERYWVPIVENVSSKPVCISPTLNMWADVLMATKPCIVNRHYHPKLLWAYTISGPDTTKKTFPGSSCLYATQLSPSPGASQRKSPAVAVPSCSTYAHLPLVVYAQNGS